MKCGVKSTGRVAWTDGFGLKSQKKQTLFFFFFSFNLFLTANFTLTNSSPFVNIGCGHLQTI